MKMKRLVVLAVCVCLLLGVGRPALAAGGRYLDVPATHWGAETAELAARYGLMEGVGDGRFDPDKLLSRGEFMAILCRMMGWEPQSVPQGAHWSAGHFAAAKAHGVEPDGTADPAGVISRREMAVLLVRALGLEWLVSAAGGYDDPFLDSAGDGYVNLAYHIGLSNGIPQVGGVAFKPNAGASRMEAAAMAVRFYERYTGKADWLHGFYAFSSYGQIGFTREMDAVSVGWARMSFDPQTGPWVNTTPEGGNEWCVPSGSETARGYFRENGTPCHLSVFCSAYQKVTLPDGTETNTLAAAVSPTYRSAAVAALVKEAEGYDGLTVDFEGLFDRDGSRGDLTAFMEDLRRALPEGKGLYMAVPPGDWYDGYDYRALGEVCDRLILMAHDYQWTSVPADYVGTHNTDDPGAPLDQVYRALCQITDPETGVRDPSKVALAVSFGTVGLEVEEDADILADTAIYSPGPEVLAKRLRQSDAELCWSEEHQTPYVFYHDEAGKRYKVWYEDARSVTAKLELARLFGLGGLSLWRLGIVPAEGDIPDFDVWSAITQEK